jgi:hypothetical protein
MPTSGACPTTHRDARGDPLVAGRNDRLEPQPGRGQELAVGKTQSEPDPGKTFDTSVGDARDPPAR